VIIYVSLKRPGCGLCELYKTQRGSTMIVPKGAARVTRLGVTTPLLARALGGRLGAWGSNCGILGP